MEYVAMGRTQGGYIIYNKNGVNMIIGEDTYEIIKNNLRRVGWNEINAR